MLVEDDKSLREIYGVRLLAEGYDIVSAGDGEEALAMAIKERPQLIVSDVMMPKVSGYDMLDILRSTTETKNIRVIMMTALSSEEQRLRAESLGADRYLVKSQVGIEDVVRVVHEVLEDTPAAMAAAAAQPVSIPAPAAPVVPVQTPPAPTTVPMPSPRPMTPVLATPGVPVAPAPAPIPAPVAPVSAMKSQGSAPKPASLKTRIIQPLHDPSISPVNINDLLDKELAKEAGLTSSEIPVVETVDQEKAMIDEQLRAFVPPEPTPVELPTTAPSMPVAPPSPSLLPTPGVGGVASAPIATPAPLSAQQPSVIPVSVVTTPVAPVPPVVSVPVPPAPQVAPPIPHSPFAPFTAAPAQPVTAVQDTQPVPPRAPESSPEPSLDLTKLPDVPTVQ